VSFFNKTAVTQDELRDLQSPPMTSVKLERMLSLMPQEVSATNIVQQAKAWRMIVDVLNEVSPGWGDVAYLPEYEGSVIELALATIRKLHRNQRGLQ